jgi:DNA recombination protein RmuC
MPASNFLSNPFMLILIGVFIIGIYLLIRSQRHQHQFLQTLETTLNLQAQGQTHQIDQLTQQLNHLLQNQFSESLLKMQQLTAASIQSQMKDVREQINHSFQQHAQGLTTHLHSLSDHLRLNLTGLSEQVNQQLSKGFESTSSTFMDVIKRLTIIDEAQKKITELSSHVVSLQDVLMDKKARGAFGEVQLSNLISNMMPPSNYRMQYTLSNQKRADCILFLPEPTGNLVIDAKFPLETFQKLSVTDPLSYERKQLQQQFKQDLQKHLKDIAEKYIIPEETADGAILFIPAESIFAEIHANYPEIVALSQRLRVWLVSPSTLMAVLTTARAVLKDDATRKQVHIIQKHLQALAIDFERFEKRMDKLSKHIDLAHQDVSEVNTSAKKIAQRFHKIESVELEPMQLPKEVVPALEEAE